ncbi:MAG: hypothetical protein FRX49_03251 [Trebouxia sp. A1-2]|nr:MAG: hypothetical protein FRX49_03251 [Trebouxia sp. A1-2]
MAPPLPLQTWGPAGGTPHLDQVLLSASGGWDMIEENSGAQQEDRQQGVNAAPQVLDHRRLQHARLQTSRADNRLPAYLHHFLAFLLISKKHFMGLALRRKLSLHCTAASQHPKHLRQGKAAKDRHLKQGKEAKEILQHPEQFDVPLIAA